MALLDERSIIVQPSLVRCLGGMHQAAVLQQIHFHLQDAEEAALTRSQLSEEIGLSSDQIKRATRSLIDLGVLEANQRGGWNRTNGWRINRDTLQALLDDTGSAASPIGRNRPMHRADTPTPLGGIAQCSTTTRDIRGLETRAKDRASFQDEFASIWEGYPRKLARKAAESAFVARRRAGIDLAELAAAVEGYALRCRVEGTGRQFIMYGATFFGPSERWKDWVGWDASQAEKSASKSEERMAANFAAIQASREQKAIGG